MLSSLRILEIAKCPQRAATLKEIMAIYGNIYEWDLCGLTCGLISINTINKIQAKETSIKQFILSYPTFYSEPKNEDLQKVKCLLDDVDHMLEKLPTIRRIKLPGTSPFQKGLFHSRAYQATIELREKIAALKTELTDGRIQYEHILLQLTVLLRELQKLMPATYGNSKDSFNELMRIRFHLATGEQLDLRHVTYACFSITLGQKYINTTYKSRFTL
jgi:hypothetical protein